MVQSLGTTAGRFLRRLKVEPIHDPVIPPPGADPRAVKTQVHTRSPTQRLPAALLATAKRQKPPECPSTGDWINTVVLFTQWDIIWP